VKAADDFLFVVWTGFEKHQSKTLAALATAFSFANREFANHNPHGADHTLANLACHRYAKIIRLSNIL
jgi:hypothetical protein